MMPSGLRLVPLYDGMEQPQWSQFDPSTLGVFGVDFSRVLRGGSIVRAEARASSPLVPMACTVAGSVVSVALTGGTDGQTGRVEITVTFQDGQTDVWAILLPIVEQSTLEATEVVLSPTTTSDATPTVIASIPVLALNGSAANVEGTVLARNVTTGDACSWRVSAVIENIGTPNVSAGSPSITAYETPASLSGTALGVSVSNNIIMLFATGLAGTQILWTPNLETTVA